MIQKFGIISLRTTFAEGEAEKNTAIMRADLGASVLRGYYQDSPKLMTVYEP